MYSPIHATAGLLIALNVPDPLIGIPLAIASHYLLDAIPHGDTGLGPWMTVTGKKHRLLTVESIDLGTAAVMVWFLITVHPTQPAWYLLAGAIGGILPDLLWGLRFIIDQKNSFHYLSRLLHVHDRLHSWGHAKHNYDIPFRAGLILQGLVLAVVILLQR